ncbi:MAG: Gfo/Idh/MocA family oxidoreductase [Ignavibacteria bacterium]|nr:Gfo/Idh/MocA family oxidoreductase [Ignavibacteria bacterium]
MINVGVIGAGYWGPNLIRNFIKHNNANLKKVCDLKEGRLEFIRKSYPDLSLTKDSNEIINNPGIDAVVIATPVNTHKEIAIKSIEKGKHVFIEKPLSDNYNDALEVVNSAEKNDRILAVGHIFQFAPAVTAIKREIENGLLGELYHFSSQRINLGPPETTVDVVWDLGSHDLSILFYLFDEYPNCVNAFGSSYWWNGIIDNAHIFLDFPGKRTAHIHLSWLSSNKIRSTSIFGSEGNIEYDETKPDEEKVIFYDKGIDSRINAKDSDVKDLKYGKGETKNIVFDKGEPLYLEVDAFINAILKNEQPINNGIIGCEVVKVLEQASKSIKFKQ